MRRTLLFVGSLVLVAASIAVITAQHAAPAPHNPMEMLHSLCVDNSSAASAKAHVPEHFAKLLDLSAAQLADIERLAGEACTVLQRTHENILQVLTPEQRAKVKDLHGGDTEPGGLHAFFKKLHGGD